MSWWTRIGQVGLGPKDVQQSPRPDPDGVLHVEDHVLVFPRVRAARPQR